MLRAPPELTNDNMYRDERFASGQRNNTRDPSSNNNSGTRQVKLFKKQ